MTTHTKQILGLFPGQGSQKVGMGLALCQQSELARDLFDRADKAVGFPLSKICFEGPAEQLTSTAVAQPAILTVSVICYRLFESRIIAMDPGSMGARLSVVAGSGHSLGEYSALVAAGALSFEDAVALVHKRGRYMQEAVPSGVGRMVAILGREVDEIEAACREVSNSETCIVQIANINAPGQVVVAGKKESVGHCLEKLAGAKSIELPVSAPFHCALMKTAEENLARDLAGLNIQPCRFPVYANYHAKPLADPNEIREALRLQVCGRVRWVECMQNALGAHQPTAAIEFGFGNVLTGLLKRIDNSVPRFNVDSIDSLAVLEKDQ